MSGSGDRSWSRSCAWGTKRASAALEDDLCAEALVDLLQGGPAPATATVRERLREAPAAEKFFDPACDWAPAPDFDYCTEVDRFDFVLRLRRGETAGSNWSASPCRERSERLRERGEWRAQSSVSRSNSCCSR